MVHDGTRPVPKKVKTAGAVVVAAPADAEVLFDGSDSSAFTVPWTVKDGIMIATQKDTHTKKSYADCQMHFEWRIPAGREVKNQGGGNSGVFFMDLYEVQIQESHKNVTYADGQAGALYGQTPPLVNASTAQGEWQSYDILFTAPRYSAKGMVEPAYVTVVHNGVVIHQHQQFYGATTWRKIAQYPATHKKKAPIRLQWHGDPIEFRNVWIRPLGQ